MIISASRRTDIPAFYFEWFLNRIKEGYVFVRNPMNYHQVSKVSLAPEDVECIVFWSKNPAPMLNHLSELLGYQYYIQFTLNLYGNEIEEHLPSDKFKLIETFKTMASAMGSARVVWRYDPILINPSHTVDYHIEQFEKLAESLSGYTKTCFISFIDFYPKIKKKMELLAVRQVEQEERRKIAKAFAEVADKNQIQIVTCMEEADFSSFNVGHGSCIDAVLIEKLTGRQVKMKGDKTQRPGCRCITSVDIGTYDTCVHGCQYCYANSSKGRVLAAAERYDPASPLLCGKLGPDDIVRDRKVEKFLI